MGPLATQMTFPQFGDFRIWPMSGCSDPPDDAKSWARQRLFYEVYQWICSHLSDREPNLFEVLTLHLLDPNPPINEQ